MSKAVKTSLKLKDLPPHPDLAKLEETVIKFWEETDAFQKSIDLRPEDKSYVFYDGPPFATGLPHYGHIVASTIKDIIPRYFTMKGRRVERKWGWDCHGLPIENIAEKELGIKSKKEIEELGVDKFNQACESKILSYVNEWKKIIRRLGRWVDMENDYKTMDLSFMESVWWVFKELYDRGLIYYDYRSIHVCPRCETTLSQSEVTEGYKEITDISVIAKFKLTNAQEVLGKVVKDKNIYALAWTTTPWTLPGNVLLAVHPEMTYVLFASQEPDNLYLMAKSRLKDTLGDDPVTIVAEFKGKDLVSLKYEPLFPYFAKTENAFRVVTADFVSDDDGVGIVHIAPAFGEDDFNLGKREGVPLIHHVNLEGKFVDEVTDFASMKVKPKEDPTRTDVKIVKWLAHHNKLFAKKKLKHKYPHCWRCDTPLLNYATGSYFVKVTAIKNKLLKLAENIYWMPPHIKKGRWLNWLKGAKDWSISRQRYWASVIPIWKCDCGWEKVYGSVAELEKDSGQKVTDLHKHMVDKITVTCPKCGKPAHRIPDVLDTWFDSGSMPYGQMHYPFENKEKFEANFPAEFIAEGIDQTRAWFYYLHVIATGIKNTNAFKNVIVNGIVLAEDGQKMSKRLKNYPDPSYIMDQYGSDSLRLYLASSPVMKAEDLRFSEKEVAQIRRKVFLILWNMFSFLKLYANLKPMTLSELENFKPSSSHVMDRWALSLTHSTLDQVTKYLDAYDLVRSSRAIMNLINELSTWYLRRSRDRLREDKTSQKTFAYILALTSQMLAPFAPFMTEFIFQNLVDLPKDKPSVHHTDWPKVNQKFMDADLEQTMVEIRKVAEKAHALRKENQVKLRQPLAKLTVTSTLAKPNDNLLDVLADEVNVKLVVWQTKDKLKVELDFDLTDELKAEGEARELVREIQKLRKQLGLKPEDLATFEVPQIPTGWQDYIESKTRSKLTLGSTLRLKKS